MILGSTPSPPEGDIVRPQPLEAQPLEATLSPATASAFTKENSQNDGREGETSVKGEGIFFLLAGFLRLTSTTPLEHAIPSAPALEDTGNPDDEDRGFTLPERTRTYTLSRP